LLVIVAVPPMTRGLPSSQYTAVPDGERLTVTTVLAVVSTLKVMDSLRPWATSDSPEGSPDAAWMVTEVTEPGSEKWAVLCATLPPTKVASHCPAPFNEAPATASAQ
jgi:hypothetical protein